MRRPKLGRPRLPRTRAGQRRLVQAVMAGCVLALLPATWMYVVTGDRLRTTADVPRTDVAVVFGAGLWDGEPSLSRPPAGRGGRVVPRGADQGGPGHRRQQPQGL